MWETCLIPLFLDIETTGRNEEVDEITEMAWIRDDGAERQFFVEHTRLPNQWVLDNTDYVRRILPAKKIPLASALHFLHMDCGGYRNDGQAVHLVGAAPTFDDRFIRKAYHRAGPIVNNYTGQRFTEPAYHYHVIDIEVLVMGWWGMDVPPHLREIRKKIKLPGEFEAQHTAIVDAREVKLIWDTIMVHPERCRPVLY